MKHLRFETFRLERMNSYIQLQQLFGRFGEVPGVYFSGLHTPQQGRGKIGMNRTLFAFPLADTYSRVWVFHCPKRWWLPHPLVSHPKTPQSHRLPSLLWVEICWNRLVDLRGSSRFWKHILSWKDKANHQCSSGSTGAWRSCGTLACRGLHAAIVKTGKPIPDWPDFVEPVQPTRICTGWFGGLSLAEQRLLVVR